jgi:predicted unusual protein kinase regulating ubiquinone biosynthesis (AarF/ABC1/UbiB family)
MRADLIGEGYAAALSELQDNVPPFDSRLAMSIVEAELGAPPEAIFSFITDQPIASASLGQVGGGWRGWCCALVDGRCLHAFLWVM